MEPIENQSLMRRVGGWMFLSIPIAFPVFSAATATHGAYMAMEGEGETFRWIYAAGVAMVAFLFLGAVTTILFRVFPRADGSQRLKLLGGAVLVGIALFGFTTTYSVMTLGGSTVMRIQYKDKTDQAENAFRANLSARRAELSIVPVIKQDETQFNTLAAGEGKSGNMSGTSGQGTVVITLRAVASSLNGLQDQITTSNDLDAIDAKGTIALSELRGIADDTVLSTSDKQRKYAAKLAEVRELNDKLIAGSVLTLINQTSSYLNTIANLNIPAGTSDLARRQGEAIDKAKGLVAKVQADIQDLLKNHAEPAVLPNASFLELQTAVYEYAFQIPGAWLPSIMADFSWIIFLLFLAIAQDLNLGVLPPAPKKPEETAVVPKAPTRDEPEAAPAQ